MYGPNAGDRPERPRLQYKLRFLAALKAKLDALTAAGREVGMRGHCSCWHSCGGSVRAGSSECTTARPLASHCRPALQVILVGDLNIPAEPRDMHPALGPYSESYGEEERAALAGLMASYPGGRAGEGIARGGGRGRHPQAYNADGSHG